MKRLLPYLLVIVTHSLVFHHAWSNRQEIKREEWKLATFIQRPARDQSFAHVTVESGAAGAKKYHWLIIPKDLERRLPGSQEQRVEFLVRWGRHNEPWIADVRLPASPPADKIAP